MKAPRILIIDDNADLLAVISMALQHAGYAITVTSNGRTGLKLIRQDPPDLVITDIFMPDQDGIGVAMELGKEFPATPLIAMSGESPKSPFYLKLVGMMGARYVLTKPFSIKTLLEAVGSVLPAPGPSVPPVTDGPSL